MALANGDQAGLVDLYLKRAAAAADDAERVRCCVRVAELAADQGASEALLRGLSEVLGATCATGRPLRSLARVAEAAGYVEKAPRALGEAGEDGREGARLRKDALGDTTGAVQALTALVEEKRDTAAAAALVRTSAPAAARGHAHLLLAEAAVDATARGQHALLAAPALEEAGLDDEALAAWRAAFEADPRPGHAADGLRRILVARKDTDGLRALFAALPASHRAGLGDALEEADDLAGAIAAWKDELATATDKLPWSVRLEQALGRVGEWKQVFELLQARAADAGPETRSEIAVRSRWLLAEKLAETEEAWDFYRQLHANNPEDTEVLKALARIAGARGETGLAAQYLEGLAARAQAPRDTTRYH
ncbi:MAG: tetratricopeptide repeat protein, partial [Myxococcota bacterium]